MKVVNRSSNFRCHFFCETPEHLHFHKTDFHNDIVVKRNDITEHDDHQRRSAELYNRKKTEVAKKKDFVHKLAFIFIFAISACCHSHDDGFLKRLQTPSSVDRTTMMIKSSEHFASVDFLLTIMVPARCC